ncbi:hypothetical protein JGU66_15855 [Myxococcaceae bacterium JPH2]|nr:hypothetical protein [Myxococcaceae bacterium JPH2]
MESWRILLAPFYAAALAAWVVAAITFGRREPGPSLALRVHLLWLTLLAVGSLLVLVQFRHESLMEGDPFDTLGRALASGLLVLAGALAVSGSRERIRAVALRSCAPLSLDEAVAELRAGRPPGVAVYRGVLDATDSLLSPGGVTCAFYDAAVHAVAPRGRRGPLLSRERAYVPVLSLRGTTSRATVCFAPSTLRAPLEVRRCRNVSTQAEALREPADALSWERVGLAGEACLVEGELRPGRTEGSYELRGRDGRPALIILGDEAPSTGAVLARRAWGHFAVAGALSATAMLVLSRAM